MLHSSKRSGSRRWMLSFSRTKLQQWPQYLCWPPRTCQTLVGYYQCTMPTVIKIECTWINACTGEISISSIWVSAGRSGQPGPGYILLLLWNTGVAFRQSLQRLPPGPVCRTPRSNHSCSHPSQLSSCIEFHLSHTCCKRARSSGETAGSRRGSS